MNRKWLLLIVLLNVYGNVSFGDTVNKCINPNNPSEIIYTQFARPKHLKSNPHLVLWKSSGDFEKKKSPTSTALRSPVFYTPFLDSSEKKLVDDNKTYAKVKVPYKPTKRYNCRTGRNIKDCENNDGSGWESNEDRWVSDRNRWANEKYRWESDQYKLVEKKPKSSNETNGT